MNNIMKSAYMFFNKIKVVHSIPGRLRLSIPGLNQVPEDLRKYDYYTTEVIKMEPGIKEVSYSYITGKMLILYDQSQTDEKKIVEWLNEIWKKVVDNQSLYENMTQEEIEKNAENFYQILRSQLKRG